ncbi:MAG TPA: ABC transporter permease, partial [Terracidiphilus sp.]
MMHARVLYQMMRADFLERVRRTSFLLALGFSLFLAYAVYTGQVALELADYRGLPNSAWIGSVIGLVASVWLSLVGFYVVKNSIERDRQTRVGQILAATPLSKAFYTLGKVLSNFAVLAAMVLVLAVGAVAIQLANPKAMHLDLPALLLPVLLFGLSAVALVAALAVLFETLPVLRGGVGNALYVFLWIMLIILGVPPTDPGEKAAYWAPLKDYTGIGTLMGQMSSRLYSMDPGYKGGASFTVGNLHPPTKTFLWTGLDWTAPALLGRLAPVAAAILLALLAAVFFDRFDPARGGL